MQMSAASILRWIAIALWLATVVVCLSLYAYDPQAFSSDKMVFFLSRFEGEILLIYCFFSVVRGFTLLPSTPLVIAGTILYPHQPWLVLFISLSGILLSSSMIYFFSDFLGFTDYFERKHASFIHKTKDRLEKPSGLFFVFLWALCPFVPTDVVCYVAGTSKMSFLKFIAAVGFGELLLCSFYIFFGGMIFGKIT